MKRYEFGPELPINPVDPGTSLLVMKPSIGSAYRPMMKLLACTDEEGLILVTTTDTGEDSIERYRDCGCSYHPERMAVIDCSEGANPSEPHNIHSVSGPDDLTGISILYSSLYEQLHDSGVSRIRAGFSTLAPLLVYVDDFRRLFRFLNSLTGRISSAEGFGAFAIDPESVESKTLHSLSEAFDGVVNIRSVDGDGRFEFKMQGLGNQPDGWQPFTLNESRD